MMASKRRLEMTPSRCNQDPDYEIITMPTAAKRQRVQEEDAKDQTVHRMQVVIKKQFNLALIDKEKEIELVDERLQKARIQLDKLRACIVARYYGKAGLSSSAGEKSKQKLDLSHPAIQRALGAPLQSSSPPPIIPLNEGDTTLSRPSSHEDPPHLPVESGRSTPIGELLSRTDAFLDSDRGSPLLGTKGPRNLGEDTFGVGPPLDNLKPPVSQIDAGQSSRLHVKKRIIVGNVSKYIPPGHREDSDPSTHKWMVYVRGPPEEPRIHHFVEKVWFFLHPSYRPNDLLEVKEPPFHLTRRGWGEFPIRVQLHFKDPRNKKVDIIHHLKLDRTYTGLQTLGAETIVDVELDRYLFNESGDPLSRPSTPTVTKVNYKEGLKPDLSRVPTPIRSSLLLSNDDARRQNLTSPSPLLLETLAKTPDSTPDGSRPASRNSSLSSPLVKTLAGEDSSRATPISIDSNFDKLREENSDMTSSSALSLGKLSSKVKAQSGPALLKPIRTMPPLGPISSKPIETIKSTQVSPITSESIPLVSSSLISGNGVGKDTQVSPTQTGAINVGDIARASPGSKQIRIRDGQIIQDMPSGIVPPSQTRTDNKKVVTLNQPVLGSKTNGKVISSAGPSTVALQRIPGTSLSGRPQTIVSSSNQSIQNTVSVAKQPVIASPVVGKGQTGVTLVQQTPSSVRVQQGQQPGIMPVMSNPPAGTQYYVTAKSTDKNLQGKVILIPQQVFSGQSGKGNRGSNQGQSTKQGSGSFLSPSNVLILPQGSIVPPLPPGSIVQIQPVPNPSSRPSPPLPQPNTTNQPMTRIALTQKSGASTIISPKPATQRVGSGGGVIQIQRSAGQTLAKLVPAALGTSTSQQVSSSISLIPEMKGQLARTPAGGVVLVQRTPASKSTNIQAISGIQNVMSGPISQKIALNPIPMAGLSQQKVSLPIKGGASVLLSQASKAVSSKTVVLQSQPPSSMTNSTKTIQVRTGQPTVKTITKFVPPLDDVKGHISKVSDKLLTGNTIREVGGDGLLKDDTPCGTSIPNNASNGSRLSNNSLNSVSAKRSVLIEADKAINDDSIVEATSSKSALSTEGEVQSLESMQVNASEICSDVEVTNNVIIQSDISAPKDNTLHGSSNVCTIAIKEEPNEETMEVDVEQTSGNLNGHCNKTKSIFVKQNPQVMTRTNNIGEEVKKTNGTVVCDLAQNNKLSVSTPKTNITSNCMIKVVNTKLQKPSCLAIDASKTGNKVRVIRIKQEPGTDPVLATLASAPILTVDESKEGMIVRKEDEGGGWESKELRLWKRILEEHFEEQTNLYGVTSVEQLVKYVAEQAPLIDPTRVQNELPFCATSLEHYHSWTLAKRRSMEWQRAVYIHAKVSRLKSLIECLHSLPTWSKKKIVLWCRHHGFTPPEPGLKSKAQMSICKLCGKTECKGSEEYQDKYSRTTGCLRNHLSKTGVLKNTTFSVPDELGERLKASQSRGINDDDDIEIDIISLGDPSKRLKVKTEGIEKQQLKCFMPPSEGALCVREAAEKIGVHFRPVQVGEDTYSPVIQEMIYAATRQFLGDLVRTSLSKSFGNSKEHRLPEEILPLHVHQAVSSLPSCDFLTNNHLGVIASSSDCKKE
ncbi:YEATS domain-containing protein 2-like [Lytechinus pictus]|uniref:YEATS domain-containing protein 2-like n=1 Tax=Lytechinus pictus TaxID=7653 RepID=UPI0030BA1948